MSDTLILDVETKHSFADVGGRQNLRSLGISVAGVYSYNRNEFFALEEREIGRLEKMVCAADHVVGFNLKQFDIPVIEPYLEQQDAFSRVVITDMFEDAVNFLGHRVGLNALAKATLGTEKSGDGLEALAWFKEGKIDEVKKYCLDDVRITRDLYEHGKTRGHVLFESRTDGKIHSIPVEWEKKVRQPIARIIEEAFVNRRRVRIEYVSSEDGDGAGFRKTRDVDVYRIKPGGQIEAYCHLRQAVREFRINRIMSAELRNETYSPPQDFQAALFA